MPPLTRRMRALLNAADAMEGCSRGGGATQPIVQNTDISHVLQACGEELVMWMYPEERAVWRLVCKQACEHVYICTDGLRYDPYSSIYSYSCISRNKAAAEPAQY